jgi:hypothetical protein
MGQNCSFQLLAPAQSRLTDEFSHSIHDEQLYDHYLASLQRVRGRVYLKDRAIRSWELDDDGRYHMHADEQSWHLLLVDEAKEVIGCAKYLVHSSSVAYDRLRVSHSHLAKDPVWGPKVRRAIEADLRRVREEKLHYVEVGGWALDEQWRGSRAALEILVGSFALGDIWGGCIGSCTATVRHGSSSMLRRIGGCSFESGGEELPPYEDPDYDCRMELLRFDYRSPAKRFLPLIGPLKAMLAKSVVLTRTSHVTLPRLSSKYIGGPAKLLQLTPVFIS